ncbi:MAG TPA: SMC-Scp complex subunit ScpB [Polyangia bacterium]
MARKKTGDQGATDEGTEAGTPDLPEGFEEIPTDPGIPRNPEAEGEPSFLDEHAEPTRPGAYVASFDAEEDRTERLRVETSESAADEVAGAVPEAVDPAGDATGPLLAHELDEPTSAGEMVSEAPPSPDEALEFGAEVEPELGQVLDLARAREEAAAAGAEEGEGQEEGDVGRVPFEQLESLIEALLFASDKPVGMTELKRLTGERDTRLVTQALESLIARRKDSGLNVVTVAGAYSLRTNPAFADWVSKLVAGKPVRLSRAMLETLAIVAYRQPITRPEIDDVRGVDCGPVLKTLLDRNLVRIIGKSEEVGRPMLYGTTAEFLRIFSLKDLTQLPTLRQFHELSAEHQQKVDEVHPPAVPEEVAPSLVGVAAPVEPLASPGTAPDPGEDDRLMAELEEASEAANRAAGPLSPEAPPPPDSREPQGNG